MLRKYLFVVYLLVFSLVNSYLVLGQAIHTLPFIDGLSLTCGYGCYSGHEGSDYSMSGVEGKLVVASADGLIENASDTNAPNDPDIALPNYPGNYIVIDHGTHDGVQVKTYYFHLQSASFLVKDGRQVYRGQPIALVGNSGTSTAPHLHFEVRHNGSAVDPYSGSNYLWTESPPIQRPHDFVGYYENGWQSNGTSQAFVNMRNQYPNEIGEAFDNDGKVFTHFWDDSFNPGVGVWLQDYIQPDPTLKFANSTDGEQAIILAENNTQAFLVKEGFWGAYKDADGYRNLGPPETNEYVDTDGLTKQDFKYGILVWDGNNVSIEAKVTAQLVIQSQVTINSSPDGVDVYNNDDLVGTTNSQNALTFYGYEGFTYDMVAKKAGYNDEPFSFTVPKGDLTVDVTLVPSGSGSGNTDLMAITPLFLDFASSKNNLSLTISKETTNHDLAWTATPSQSWITCTPSSGTATSVPSVVLVSVDYTGLSGTYEETVAINSTAGTIQVPILLDANSQWPSSPVTYDFSDESQLDDWLLIDGTPDSSGIKNGVLKLVNGGPGTSNSHTEAYLIAAGSIFDSVSVTFILDNGAQKTNNQSTKVILCHQDDDTYYEWHIAESSSGPIFKGVNLTKFDINMGTPSSTVLFNSGTILPSGTYTASYVDGVIRLQDDQGGSVFDESYTDSSPLHHGRIGFATNEETTTFDDVSISGTTYYTNNSLPSTVLGLWNMDGAAGSTAKKKNEKTNVSLAETSVSSATDHAGTLDGAYSFNGSSYLTTDIDINGLNQLTIAAWVKTDVLNAHDQIMGRWQAGARSFAISWYNDNRLFVSVAQDVNDTGANSNVYVSLSRDTNWHHYVVVYDGTATPSDRVKIYYDGTLQTATISGTIPTSLTMAGASAFVIGNYEQSTSGPPHTGSIDYVRIDNDTWTQSEVTADYLTNAALLSIQSSLDLGSAESGILQDSLLITNIEAIDVSGASITTTGNVSLDSSSVTLLAGQSRKYKVTVNLDPLADGTYTDTVRVAEDNATHTLIVTYTKSTVAPSTVLGTWYMDGSLASNAKRTNEETGALLTEVGVSSGLGHTSLADEAYLFNGSSYAVTDLDSELDGISQLTIAMWVKTTATSYNQLLGRWNVGNRQLAVSWHFNNQISFTYAQDVNDSGGNSNSYAMAPSRDTNWHHIVFVYDGQATPADRSKIYYDGQGLAMTIAGTIPTSLTVVNNTAQPLIIGNYEQSTTGPPHTGSIDVVKIDKAAWTASDVTTHYNSGLAKRGSSDELSGSAIPDKFALHQNYPNPFNPATEIRFDLPERSQVNLTIYNVLGQKIATLVDESMPAGVHSISWNTSDESNISVTTGVYIYRIEAGRFVQTRKMLLIK